MPENSFKNNLPWTEAHEAFCYQHHIPPAAKSLWQWLMRLGYIGSEIEPDLSEFKRKYWILQRASLSLHAEIPRERRCFIRLH